LQVVLQPTRPGGELIAISRANEQFVAKGLTQPLQDSAHGGLTEVVAGGGS